MRSSAPVSSTPPWRRPRSSQVSFRSFPRKREGGFTLEVQHFGEGLGRSPEVKTLAGCVVVGADELVEALACELAEIGLSRKEAAHSTDGVLDAALLPGRMGVAEEGLHVEPMQRAMACELGAVVEGDGSTQLRRHLPEQAQQMARNPLGRLVAR